MSEHSNITDTRSQRFGSFAPIREGVEATFFVDGEDYFHAVSEALDAARETIYIEDWWLSPELYLRRPYADFPEFRLDNLLQRKAEEGVQIRVVVYKEMEMAMSLASRRVKDVLQALHPNIRVARHPDHGVESDDVLFWAHHEKMIIVDSHIAFAGGLDLCYGRYDTHAHRLSDSADIIWPGQDYNNPRRKDFINLEQYDVTLIDRLMEPRMPWHDVSFRVTGRAAYDIGRHFCERWNFVKADKYKDNDAYDIIAPSLQAAETYAQAHKGTCRLQVLRSSCEWSSGVPHEHSILNAYLENIERAEHFIYIENQFFISNASGNPKYDISNTIAAALIKRILRAVSEGRPFRVIVAMPLMPAFEAELDEDAASTLRVVMHWQYQTISRGGSSIFELLAAQGLRPEDYITFYGLRNYDLIKEPSKYPSVTEPSTLLPHALAERAEILEEEVERREAEVLRAKEKEENALFGLKRHIPEFARNLLFGDDDDHKLQDAVIPESEAKEEAVRDLEQGALYLSELTYIHTKLMIVDDRTIICGSANINDRSLLGNRDSEVAVVIEDQDLVPSRMNGEHYQAGRLAHELRLKIFREHLGLAPETQMRALAHLPPHAKPHQNLLDSSIKDILHRADRLLADPLSSQFWDLWSGTAAHNTQIFRDMFRCVPEDSVRTWEDYKAFIPNPEEVLRGHVADASLGKREIHQRLSKIQGHLVQFPTKFLEGEELKATAYTAEALMPEDLFT